MEEETAVGCAEAGTDERRTLRLRSFCLWGQLAGPLPAEGFPVEGGVKGFGVRDGGEGGEVGLGVEEEAEVGIAVRNSLVPHGVRVARAIAPELIIGAESALLDDLRVIEKRVDVPPNSPVRIEKFEGALCGGMLAVQALGEEPDDGQVFGFGDGAGQFGVRGGLGG
jgi:hypothetical protein